MSSSSAKGSEWFTFMICQWLMGVFLVLGALGACKSGDSDTSEGLKNANANERSRAALALGDSRDRAGALRLLKTVLRHDPDRFVRGSAALALGQLGGPDAIALLVETAASTDEPSVRGSALGAIATSRDPRAVTGLVNLFRLPRGQDDDAAQFGARQALLKIGAPGVPQLLQALNDSSTNVRKQVVAVLGEMALGGSQHHAEAVRALAAVLRHDPDREVRVFAARALGQLGGPDAIAVLVEKMTSTDEAYVRGAALFAIETSRDPSAIQSVVNVFRLNHGRDDAEAQIEASQALVKIGPSGVPQLLQALNDPSANVRRAVVDVLGKIGNAEVADRITGLHADPDPAVRQAVERALASLKGKPAPTTP